jgi:hypothetical protein
LSDWGQPRHLTTLLAPGRPRGTALLLYRPLLPRGRFHLPAFSPDRSHLSHLPTLVQRSSARLCSLLHLLELVLVHLRLHPCLLYRPPLSRSVYRPLPPCRSLQAHLTHPHPLPCRPSLGCRAAFTRGPCVSAPFTCTWVQSWPLNFLISGAAITPFHPPVSEVVGKCDRLTFCCFGFERACML